LIYIFLLLPTLGFLNQSFFVFSFVADHWQYLACLGIITPCASGIVLMADKLKPLHGWLESGVTLVLGGLLFLLTWQESRAYTDIETLYRTAIARNPACWMAEVNLGNLLYQTNRISEAMDLFKQAERVKPALAHYSFGNSLFNAGRTSEAIEQYKEALRIDPDYAEAHSNLGNVFFTTGRLSEAMEQYKETLRIDPDFAAAHNNLAIALVQTGQVSEAIDHYKQSLRISPNSAYTHANLAAALAQMGRIPEAIEEIKAALRINPNDPNARNNLRQLEAQQKTSTKIDRNPLKR
jgi:protein O-mannosyl-transferase